MAQAATGNVQRLAEHNSRFCDRRLLRYSSAMPKAKTSASQSDGSNLDFEIQLWAAADKMRGHMDASEYKHVALGLIFLNYISDAFEEEREQLLFGFSDHKE